MEKGILYEINFLRDEIVAVIDLMSKKVQKECKSLQSNLVLNFKNKLIETNAEYRLLKETRSEESITQQVLALKTSHEKMYKEHAEDSLSKKKFHDLMKEQLHSAEQYARELNLQINYLQKQCAKAVQKGKIMDEEYKNIEKQVKQQMIVQMKEDQEQYVWIRNRGQRQKEREEMLEDFIQNVIKKQTFLEEEIMKMKWQNCKKTREKLIFMEQFLNKKQIKRYIYALLFSL